MLNKYRDQVQNKEISLAMKCVASLLLKSAYSVWTVANSYKLCLPKYLKLKTEELIKVHTKMHMLF
jgi:hypothetical protein